MASPAEGNKRDISGDVAGKAKVTPAMKKEAEAQKAKAIAEAKKKEEQDLKSAGTGVLRKKGGGASAQKTQLIESDIPYPVEQHGKDFEFYGPHGMAAKIPDGVDIAPYAADQEFMIDPDMVRHLMFTPGGANLPKKRLYNIKGLHKDGRLSQLPFEPQINNTAGGDPQDMIGLNRYKRKGILVLINDQDMRPVYCAAWDCFARAAQEGEFTGFCTMRHAQHTLPNRYKGGGGAANQLSALGRNATTTSVWSG